MKEKISTPSTPDLASEHRLKSYRKEHWFTIPPRRAFRNISAQVENALKESGIREGLALVKAMHISPSVFINGDEPGLHQNDEARLERIAPPGQCRHNGTSEGLADAHVKRQVTWREAVVAITDGRLDCGPWEQISAWDGLFQGRAASTSGRMPGAATRRSGACGKQTRHLRRPRVEPARRVPAKIPKGRIAVSRATCSARTAARPAPCAAPLLIGTRSLKQAMTGSTASLTTMRRKRVLVKLIGE